MNIFVCICNITVLWELQAICLIASETIPILPSVHSFNTARNLNLTYIMDHLPSLSLQSTAIASATS